MTCVLIISLQTLDHLGTGESVDVDGVKAVE
jgi:hypothetical protein